MKAKQRLAEWVFKNLAGSPEYCTPPGDRLRLEFGEMDEDRPMHYAGTQNDGSELWLAYNHGGKWLAHYRARYARQLAWFILWNWWAKATWFGLKRKIWYWALHIKVAEYK